MRRTFSTMAINHPNAGKVAYPWNYCEHCGLHRYKHGQSLFCPMQNGNVLDSKEILLVIHAIEDNEDTTELNENTHGYCE